MIPGVNTAIRSPGLLLTLKLLIVQEYIIIVFRSPLVSPLALPIMRLLLNDDRFDASGIFLGVHVALIQLARLFLYHADALEIFLLLFPFG